MHLSLICPGFAENVDYMAGGVGVSPLPSVDDRCNFHPPLGTLRYRIEIHGNVIGHGLGLHKHPGLLPDEVEYSYEGDLAALYDLHDLPFPAPAGVTYRQRPRLCATSPGDSYPGDRFLPRDDTFHLVAVERSAGLGSFHEHIVVRGVPFRNHEHITVPGHVDLADHFLEPSLACLP